MNWVFFLNTANFFSRVRFCARNCGKKLKEIDMVGCYRCLRGF